MMWAFASPAAVVTTGSAARFFSGLAREFSQKTKKNGRKPPRKTTTKNKKKMGEERVETVKGGFIPPPSKPHSPAAAEGTETEEKQSILSRQRPRQNHTSAAEAR